MNKMPRPKDPKPRPRQVVNQLPTINESYGATNVKELDQRLVENQNEHRGRRLWTPAEFVLRLRSGMFEGRGERW